MKWVALITTPHPCITDAIRLPKPKPLPPPTPQQSEIKVLSNIRWRSGMKQLQLIATVAPRSPLPDHSYYNTHLHQLTLVWDVISSLKAVHSKVNFCIDHTGTSFYMLSSQFYVRKSGYNSRGKVEHTHTRSLLYKSPKFYTAFHFHTNGRPMSGPWLWVLWEWHAFNFNWNKYKNPDVCILSLIRHR